MKIPQYQSRDVAHTQPLPGPGGGVVDVSGLINGVSRGAANFAAGQAEQEREAKYLAEVQKREADRVEANEAQLAVANADAEMSMYSVKALADARTTAPADAAGMTTGVMKGLDEWVSEREKSLPEKARMPFRVRVAGQKASLYNAALQTEISQRNANLEIQFDSGVDQAAQAAFLDPSKAIAMIANMASVARSMDAPDALKQKREIAARERIGEAAARRLAEIDPRGTLALIGGANTEFQWAGQPGPKVIKALESELNNPELDESTKVDVRRELDRIKAGGEKTTPSERVASNPVFQLLNPQQLDTLAKHAQTQISRVDSQARTGLEAAEKDVQAQVQAGIAPPRSTIPTADQYIRAFGVDGLRRYQTEIAPYLNVAAGFVALKDASGPQRAAIVASATPPPGPGFAEKQRIQGALIQAAKITETRIASDPAAYAAQAPAVQQAAAAMMQNPSPAAADAYAQATIAEQERLGVRQIRIDSEGQVRKAPVPRLLTNSQVNTIVQQFHDAKPEGAAQVIQGLEQQWGKWWPTAYGQLASDGKLPPAALVIPNMADPGSKARLAAASAIKPDDLKAMLEPTAQRDLRAAMQNAFGSAAKTFLSQGVAGNQTLSTVMDQAETLGLMYMSQGKPAAKAAEQAFTEVMGWKYGFQDTYRVPKTELPDSVAEGAQHLIRTLDGVQSFAAGSGLTPEDQKAQTLDAVRRNGFWATNSDESGLRLMVQGQDGTAYPVKDDGGQIVERSWGALRAAAEEARKSKILRRGGRVGEVSGAR